MMTGLRAMMGRAVAGVPLAGLCLMASPAWAAPFLIVGLDQKMVWDEAGRQVFSAPGRDGVSIVDLAKPAAPRIVATVPLENSIAGPPTNLAVSPDNRIAIVASSVTTVPADGGGYREVSSDRLFVIDLKTRRLAQTLTVGRKPSGLDINRAGTLALVTYRDETAVGVFRIADGRLVDAGRVEVGGKPSHVAFTPDGARALVVKQEANSVAVLDVAGDRVTFRADVPTADGPYNVDVTPDGRLGIVNDRGVLKIIDLTTRPERVIDSVKVQAGSEGMAISPRGDLAVSVALLGSNGPRTSANFHERGAITVLAIRDGRLTPVRTIEVGRIPEGVAFSPDGRYLYVANFTDENVWIFRVNGDQVTDTGRRLKLPGRPASARATPGRGD